MEQEMDSKWISGALFSELLEIQKLGTITQIWDQSTHADDPKHMHFQEQPDAFEQNQLDLPPMVAAWRFLERSEH